MLLPSDYALGQDISFLLIGLGMNRAVLAVKKLRPYLHHINIASGFFLIAIGLLLVTNLMTTITV